MVFSILLILLNYGRKIFVWHRPVKVVSKTVKFIKKLDFQKYNFETDLHYPKTQYK